MSDYRVKITIRNDRILSKIEELGFSSVVKFCKHTGMSWSYVTQVISGKIPPLHKNGEIRENVKILLENLDITLEEAFTEKQLKGFAKNSFEKKIKEDRLLTLINPINNLETKAIESDVKDKINKILFEHLLPRERYVIAKRYGFIDNSDIQTYEEIGLELRVTRERVRQMELKGIKRLSHPTIKDQLIKTGFYDVFSSVDVKRDEIEKQEFFDESNLN